MAQHAATDALLRFIEASPTPFHAVAALEADLLGLGAAPFPDDAETSAAPESLHYLVRGGGSLLAFRLPSRPSPSTWRFQILTAHTDSPCLKLKPLPADSGQGYRQWGVEIYGGVLLNSWLDRDLGVSGRIMRLDKPQDAPLLVRLPTPPLRIPQLAIHLDRQVNEQGLVLNPQRHMVPITGLEGNASALQDLIESAGGAPIKDLAWDLFLHDMSKPCYGGVNQEFIYAPRLDNLAMCHAAFSAFAAAPAHAEAVQAIALFDHEEIGSGSARGAESPLLAHTLERLTSAMGLNRSAYLAALPRSFLLSADMAHALHPNYPERHEPAHYPLMNRGPVLKQNAAQRYAGDAVTTARFLAACRRLGITAQHFINRADMGCGSTLGPILAAGTGMPTVDVGNAMLSMHSCREMAGADDPAIMTAVMREILIA